MHLAQIGWGYSVSDTINTNYFGPRRVNTEFGPLLMRPGGRIVNVGSAAGPNFLQSINDEALKTKLYQPWTLGGGIQELDDLARSPWSSSNGYGISKALLNAYTVLHGREAQPGVIVNSVSPGYIETDLTKGRGATNPPSKGAVPICKLLMDEAFADPKLHPPGRYYGSDAVRSPLHYYRDPGEAPYENDEDLLYTGATT
jgi:NAD(P)-dependent dehydrogenase (short-subunit alcohol dehydrogenase family)